MTSVNLKVVLLIAIYSCNILTHPVKVGMPHYSENFRPKSLSATLLGSEFSPIPEVPKKKPTNNWADPGCAKDRISFPLKYHFDDRLMDQGLENRINVINLPSVPQQYQDYKVLIATAPAGLDLDEDSKAMTIYIVFNDENNNQSPMDLPTVYFVKKSSQRHKHEESIFLVDSNRTVTGLRSKEIEKFIKFRNKFTSRFSRNPEDTIGPDDKNNLKIPDGTSEPK